MKQKRLKKELGNAYCYEQRLTPAVVKGLLETLDGGNHFLVAASLQVGVVKLEAVVYWVNGKYALGYDLMVKDTPDSPDWICYCGAVLLLRQLVNGGYCTQKEAARIAAKIARQIGADIKLPIS